MALIVLATALSAWWSWSEIATLWKAIATPFLIVAVGGLYGAFRIRDRFGPFSWDEPVRENIRIRMLRIINAGRQLQPAEELYLRENRRLMDLFYYFVDRDKTLSEKARRVRHNGILATSFVDAGLIATAGYAAHVILAISLGRFENILWGLLFFLVWILSFAVFLPLAIGRHVELSNEQIDYIETHYGPAVCDRAESILLNMS